MTYYRQQGTVPHKRHTQFRQPDGSLYHETLIGADGFAGSHSLLYHLRPPTAIQALSLVASAEVVFEGVGPLRPRHFRTGGRQRLARFRAQEEAGDRKEGDREDAVTGRVPLLTNENLTISIAMPTEPMSYWYRYAQGDELLFVHSGRGVLESQLGLIDYRPGDYLVIPAGILWRLLPEPSNEQRLLGIEMRGHLRLPSRYLSPQGQLLEAAPYCERDLRPPALPAPRDEAGDFEVRVKARGRITRYCYRHHPLDVVGWDGCLWPFALNIEDFEPITGRIHQPPPVHQTFSGPGFVVCSFVPRLFDYHPQAIPAPYNHANVDSDEVIYYAAGQFMSRRGIEAGSLTLHPSGLPHGPHPGTYEASIGQSRTEELAVMIDTFAPLQVSADAIALEDDTYAYSWASLPVA
ncbi:MAG: homogentisate 1,2-dioxygenase [Leptolyngbya sp. SIO4C1]|nr:homogentisate 1,2-dioxygenase [Leptolyngbya sp. SIO4C1]